MDAKFNEHLTAFVDLSQIIVNTYYKKHYPGIKPHQLKVVGGRRYKKIATVNQDNDGESAWCFVDTKPGHTYGDILKPASWKAPAKHARGNIFSDLCGVEAVTPQGFIHYLK